MSARWWKRKPQTLLSTTRAPIPQYVDQFPLWAIKIPVKRFLHPWWVWSHLHWQENLCTLSPYSLPLGQCDMIKRIKLLSGEEKRTLGKVQGWLLIEGAAWRTGFCLSHLSTLIGPPYPRCLGTTENKRELATCCCCRAPALQQRKAETAQRPLPGGRKKRVEHVSSVLAFWGMPEEPVPCSLTWGAEGTWHTLIPAGHWDQKMSWAACSLNEKHSN